MVPVPSVPGLFPPGLFPRLVPGLFPPVYSRFIRSCPFALVITAHMTTSSCLVRNREQGFAEAVQCSYPPSSPNDCSQADRQSICACIEMGDLMHPWPLHSEHRRLSSMKRPRRTAAVASTL